MKMSSRMFRLLMQAVSTSETSVNFYENAWRNIPEDTLCFGGEGGERASFC
jgi:hypothetical protein